MYLADELNCELKGGKPTRQQALCYRLRSWQILWCSSLQMDNEFVNTLRTLYFYRSRAPCLQPKAGGRVDHVALDRS